MNKYGLHNKLTAIVGKADQLAEILIQASALVSPAKGCQFVESAWSSRINRASDAYTRWSTC